MSGPASLIMHGYQTFSSSQYTSILVPGGGTFGGVVSPSFGGVVVLHAVVGVVGSAASTGPVLVGVDVDVVCTYCT